MEGELEANRAPLRFEDAFPRAPFSRSAADRQFVPQQVDHGTRRALSAPILRVRIRPTGRCDFVHADRIRALAAQRNTAVRRYAGADVHGPFVDSHELLMDPNRDLETWELSLACGRLASQAGALQQSADQADRARAVEARQLVDRALELVERQRVESNVARSKAKLPELFMRMWRSGAAADADVAPTARTEHQPPSALHTLSMRAYGPFVPVPDFIGFLCAQRKTGILEVATAAATFSLELDAGDIVHAHSNHTPDGQRLGDILVAQGAIGRDALEETCKTLGGMRLGEALLERNLLTPEGLLTALEFQIQLLFNRMFEAATLGFTFWDGPPIHAYKRVRLNATSLLLEGARVSDEAHWSWRGGT
jgi:hypothetical protein